MSYKGRTVLAVVPARGGSKSIPRKNLCSIGGLSLVAHAARVAASLHWVDVRILSSDCDEICAEARAHGLDVPFTRPEEYARDMSSSVDMWRHAWIATENHYKMRFDISILLEPTSPLRTPEDIERTIDLLINNNYKAAATVSPTPAHYTPHKSLTVDNRGCVGFFLKQGEKHALRQSVPQLYHRNGLCYAVCRETLVDHGHILEDDCAAVIVDRPVVNIDDPFDLEMAEWLWNKSIKKPG
ncbi:MAG: cytidylyltransferase domain-containing protein [Desulfomonilia bacterium]